MSANDPKRTFRAWGGPTLPLDFSLLSNNSGLIQTGEDR